LKAKIEGISLWSLFFLQQTLKRKNKKEVVSTNYQGYSFSPAEKKD
jgi:hypothetical protein